MGREWREREMEVNAERIEQAIIAEVADKFLGDDELLARAKTEISAKIDTMWKTSVEAQVTAAVEQAISRGFDHEYQRVDTFGMAKGEKTTIRAELEKLISGYWNTIVDKSGKPTTGYGEKLTRAEWLMGQMVAADFQGEMKQHVINIGGSLKDKLRAELHETVNHLLSQVFHVHSADDQNQSRTTGYSHKPQTAPQ